MTINDLTVILYTSNYMDDKNPYFISNTRKQLLKAIGKQPLVIVSQKPLLIGDNSTNICLGDIGRSHLNIYKQMLIGAKEAKTDYVALAEDDILYSYEHFHPSLYIKTEHIDGKTFLYDMAKVSLFTWTKPPMFSFRTKRMVVNQLIAPRLQFIKALEERFKRVEWLLASGRPLEKIIKYWGDIGRYEKLLGVSTQETYEFYSWVPSVVFSHEHAYGYLNQGKKKKIGDLRIIELADWGKASDVLKLFYE